LNLDARLPSDGSKASPTREGDLRMTDLEGRLAIRPGAPSDAEAVGALYLELQEHHFPLQPHNPRYRVPAERWLEIARDVLQDPDGQVLIAEGEDGVVGCAVLRYEGKPWGLACQIETLIVGASARDRGAGSRLVTAAEEAARRRGAGGMRVEVIVENAGGRAFYDRLEYDELAVRLGKAIEGPPGPEEGAG
jgi:ribosomal protein S18 acetylase RimI-like enzyme